MDCYIIFMTVPLINPSNCFIVMYVVVIVCGLKPSTNVTKNSVLGVAGVLDSPPERVLKSVQVLKLKKLAGLLH